MTHDTTARNWDGWELWYFGSEAWLGAANTADARATPSHPTIEAPILHPWLVRDWLEETAPATDATQWPQDTILREARARAA